MNIGPYPINDYLNLVKTFHGNLLPGLVIGGFMADLAMRNLPEGILYDAISETNHCLPDAIQLLTPCTIGNGWLRVLPLGRYALSLYDHDSGAGVRVNIDTVKINDWPEIKNWYLKLKPRKEQDSDLLREQIIEASTEILTIKPVNVRKIHLKKRSKSPIAVCQICGEAYPVNDGSICVACQGRNPYVKSATKTRPAIKVISVEQGVGMLAVHDMTRIVPGQTKEPALVRGQEIKAGDVCRLQEMGRMHLYSQEATGPEWLHEDEAALRFAEVMAGEGVSFTTPPREGKITFIAGCDGFFTVNEDRLNAFNRVTGVACASRHGHFMVKKGDKLAGERAIPLYLHRDDFAAALSSLNGGPLFKVLPIKKVRVGILITGTEIFQGLIKDGFGPIIRAKVESYGSTVVHQLIVPDDRQAISKGIAELIDNGAELIATTAGLSVDPDDVTRLGLEDASAEDILYGAPIIPGSMTLLARIGDVRVIGVPACALYHKITGFDLLLPRLLSGIPVTREDLSRMGHGSFCLNCKACTFPDCGFTR